MSDLVNLAENMSVVLLESTDSDQTAESSRNLVSVKDTKVSISDRQITIRVNTVREHDCVGWAVHGLETVTNAVLLVLEDEHIVLVVLVMARSLPEAQVENVG